MLSGSVCNTVKEEFAAVAKQQDSLEKTLFIKKAEPIAPLDAAFQDSNYSYLTIILSTILCAAGAFCIVPSGIIITKVRAHD